MKLFDFQEKAVEEILDGNLELFFNLPTGCGKQVIAKEVLRRIKEQKIPRFADGSEVHGLPREEFA